MVGERGFAGWGPRVYTIGLGGWSWSRGGRVRQQGELVHRSRFRVGWLAASLARVGAFDESHVSGSGAGAAGCVWFESRVRVSTC